jgi:hypothetical protein
MRLKAVVVGMALCVILMGCAQPVMVLGWSRPGASYQDFLNDRHGCIGDARSQASGATADNGSGATGGKLAVNAVVYLPCMAAHGWTQGANGYQPPRGEQVYLQ